jgi:hypothetical protein
MNINEEFQGGRLGISRPDELGKNINGIISQDIFEHRDDETKDLFDADFKCNISDTTTLVRKFPKIPKDMIPKESSFIYFMCNSLVLDPQRMVDYVNSKCAEVLPFKLNIDNVIYLGRHDVDSSAKQQDLFVISNGSYGGKDEDGEIRAAIKEAYSKIKSSYTDEALTVKYGDKKYLTKFLQQNQTALNKLNDTGHYLLLITLKDTLKPLKRVKVATAICSSIEKFEDLEIKDSDIEKIGTIRGKFKATGSVFELDAFTLKVDQK